MNENIKNKLKLLPTNSGCYLMKDSSNNFIYVGKALNLKNRVSSYFVNTRSHNAKTKALVSNIADFEYFITPSELDALALESTLIKKHQPYYNILLKDGKAFTYIKINLKKEYPKVEIVRRISRDGAKYFGPYFAGISAKEIIELITTAFKLRTCNLKFSETKPLGRACLNASIGMCCAPCINLVSKKEYSKQVALALDFLNGNTKPIKQILTEKMMDFAENGNFESALIYRNLLDTLKKLDSHILTQLPQTINCDFVGYSDDGVHACVCVTLVRGGKTSGLENFIVNSPNSSREEILQEFLPQYYASNKLISPEIFLPFEISESNLLAEYFSNLTGKVVKLSVPQKGVKNKLVNLASENAKEFLNKNIVKETNKELLTRGACTQLQNLLNLKELPLRIEGYDISNISGTFKVASMVVFVNGEPAKAHYRKFKIKTVEGQNDFECMKEVLTRRISEFSGSDISFSSKPNLILIDGGKGQLGMALSALENANFSCDIVSLAKRIEEVFVPNQPISVLLPRNSYALRLLERVRDESHRFAITFHRKLRTKNSIKSSLEQIPGIGKTKQRNLFEHFKTIDKIKSARIFELKEVHSVNQKDAENIYKFFQNKKSD